MALKAPFPFFGGKLSVGDVVWRHFGNPKMYVEPFCGSAAMLWGKEVGSLTEVKGME